MIFNLNHAAMKKENSIRKISLGKRTILKLTDFSLLKIAGGTIRNTDDGVPSNKPVVTCTTGSRGENVCESDACPSKGTNPCPSKGAKAC